jgi:hypothetical protein
MKETLGYKDFTDRGTELMLNPAFLKQFESSKPKLEEIRSYLSEMINMVEESKVMSPSIQGYLNTCISRYNSLHERMRAYNAAEDAQAGFRNAKSIVEQIQMWHSACFDGYFRNEGGLFIPDNFLAIYATLRAQSANEQKKKIEELNTEIEIAKSLSNELITRKAKFVEEIDEQKNLVIQDFDKVKDSFVKQVDGLKETVNLKTQEVGIGKFSAIFKEESESYRKSANSWMRNTVLIMIALVGGVVLLFFFVEVDDGKTFQIVQYSVTKILIISSGFYSLSICMKNYRAHKHNEVLNRHRHNALTTFETFTKSTDDPQTKNAVLLEATRSIFSNQNTGYNNVDVSDSEITNKIIEYVKPDK